MDQKKKRIIFPDAIVQQEYDYLQNQVLICYLQMYGEPEPESSSWSLKDVWKVFSFHFRLFYTIFKTAPQHITNDRMMGMIYDLPLVPCKSHPREEFIEVGPTDYYFMLIRYFKTRYTDCSYAFSHFMSGSIREIKYMESFCNVYLSDDELLEDDVDDMEI